MHKGAVHFKSIPMVFKKLVCKNVIKTAIPTPSAPWPTYCIKGAIHTPSPLPLHPITAS